MGERETEEIDREFARVARSLQMVVRRADRRKVADQSAKQGRSGLLGLRAVAAIGAAIAIAFVFYAFTLHPVFGLAGTFVSPAVPLGLTVLAERLFRMTP